MNDDLDQCQYTCMTLLRNDKENEEATVMMADLAFRKNDYESAMFHFQQVCLFIPGCPIECSISIKRSGMFTNKRSIFIILHSFYKNAQIILSHWQDS